MKLDMSRIQKVKEDESTATLRHPDGHEIRIAKKGLSKQLRGQLSKLPMSMAKGGMVPPSEDRPLEMDDKHMLVSGEFDQFMKNSSGMDDNQVKKGAYAAYQDWRSLAGAGSDKISPEQEQRLQGYNEMIHPGEAERAPAGKFMSDIGIPNSALGSAQGTPSQKFMGPMGIPNAAVESAGLAPKLAAAAPVATASPPVNYQISAARSPGANPMSGLPASAFGDVGAYDKAMKGYTGALGAEAQALGAQGKVEAQAAQQQQLDIGSLEKNFNQQYKELDGERKKWMQDLESAHIDPNRYINNMSGGQKALTAIGMLIGGIGVIGNESRPNAAMQFLNQHIQNDIDSQKAELGKKQNLLSANLQQFGNMKDAMDMTRAMTADVYSAKLQQAAAQVKDPLARARAQQAATKFQIEVALPMMQQISMRRAMMGMMGQMGGTMASPMGSVGLPPMTLDDAQKRFVPGVGMARTPEDANKLMEQRQKLQPFNNLLDEVIKFRGQHGIGSNLDPTAKAQANVLARELANAYRMGREMGVFKESEKEFQEAVTPDNLLMPFVQEKLMKLKEISDDHLNSIYQAYGFQPPRAARRVRR